MTTAILDAIGQLWLIIILSVTLPVILMGLCYFAMIGLLFVMGACVWLLIWLSAPFQWLWRQVQKRPALECWLRLIFTSERTPWQQVVYAARWPFQRRKGHG